MKKVDAYQILKDEGHLNILEIVKGKGYFLDNHSHDFDVDLIIISGTLEIITNNSSVILSPGSRYKMKKNTIHTEKSDGVCFLSARPQND